MKTKKWHVYIIETIAGKFYTGITNDLEKRLDSHIKGKTGAKFFRIDPPKEIVWNETHIDRSSASKKESELKKLSRNEKIELIRREG